jgi:enoyl-CoA hydratase/carnithine racemase
MADRRVTSFPIEHVTAARFLEDLRVPGAMERWAAPTGGGVVVDLSGSPPPAPAAAADRLAGVPAVVVVAADGDDPDRLDAGWRRLADVVVAAGDPGAGAVEATVDAHPVAATALVLLLRDDGARPVGAGLAAESAVYSTLQAGPEFAAWRAGRPVRRRDDGHEPRVAMERSGDRLRITLTRPAVRNALDARMRDQLLAALDVARHDDSVRTVELRGAGPSFCAGGDLDEFGARTDPATAHLLRLARSPARALAALAGRTEAHLHGAAVGSGIELAAFARTVVAAPDTRIALPEIDLGLIPGAGGTVSLPARIGRHRTAWLALSGRTIDVSTARAWGLVDRITPARAVGDPR